MVYTEQEAVALMGAKVAAAKQLLIECQELSNEWEIPYEFTLNTEVNDGGSDFNDWESSWESSSASC